MIFSQRYFITTVNLFAALVCLVAMLVPFVSFSQTTNETTLPSKAQAAIKKGLSAAKQQEWTVAIRYFNEARQAAPDSPVPLVNLGLAESQLPGRELRAICCFEAYLALVPTAINASAVRQQIIDLDVHAEGNVQKLIELLKGAAANFSDDKKGGALANIASLLVRCGDLDAAEAIVDQSKDDTTKDEVKDQIVQDLAQSDRFADAIKLAEEFKSDDYYKVVCFKTIALAQIDAGLLSDARTSLDVLSTTAKGSYFWQSINYDPYYEVLFRLAEAEYQSGQHEQAAVLLGDAQQSIDTNGTVDPSVKDAQVANGIIREAWQYRGELAVAKYKTGEHEAAEASLQQIRDSMGDLNSVSSGYKPQRFGIGGAYGNRMNALEELAIAFNEIGQHEKAVKCLEDAAQAQIAGNAAHEFIPYSIALKYIEMQDWDRAKAQAYQEVSDYYNGGNWSKKEKDDFVASRIDAIANAKITMAYASAKASSVRTLTDATSLPAQRAQAWTDYMNTTMNTPIFTDFKVTLAALLNRAPKVGDAYRDATIFGLVKDQCDVIVNRLKDVRDMQAREINSAEKQP
jgi:tetratricopeptide (TPR) repeat protein